MALDWSEIIPTGISTIAACVSAFFAYRTKKMQTQLVENKSDIEALNELIECLKVANAISNHPDAFSDSEFESGRNLKEVPAKIAKLIQNPKIGSQITKKEWELPIEDYDIKIENLCSIRRLLC